MGSNTGDVLFVSILAVILFRNQIFTMLFLNGAVRIQFYHTFIQISDIVLGELKEK